MQLKRRGYSKNCGVDKSDDEELTSDSFFDEKLAGGEDPFPPPVSYGRQSCFCGFNGKEFFLGISARLDSSTHWYKLTLTPREMRVFLSGLLDASYYQDEEISDSEKELWGTLFDLWEERLKRLHQR